MSVLKCSGLLLLCIVSSALLSYFSASIIIKQMVRNAAEAPAEANQARIAERSPAGEWKWYNKEEQKRACADLLPQVKGGK